MSYASLVSDSAAASGRTHRSQLGLKAQAVANREENHEKDHRTEFEILKDARKSLVQTSETMQHSADLLDAQTEQLHRIDAINTGIQDDLKVSDKLIHGLTHHGPIAWVRSALEPDGEIAKQRKEAGKHDFSLHGLKEHFRGHPEPKENSAAASRGAESLRARASKVEGHTRSTQIGLDVEKEELYADLEDMVGDIKNRSKDIKRVIESHNDMLPEIVARVDENYEKITRQEAQLKSIR